MCILFIVKLFLLQMADTAIDCATEAILFGVPKDENDITQESVQRLTQYIKEM
jgi:hypothetical protein